MGQWLFLLSVILVKQMYAQDVSRIKGKSDLRTNILKALSALISEAKEAKATSESHLKDTVCNGYFASFADYDEIRQKQRGTNSRQEKGLNKENVTDPLEEFEDYEGEYEVSDEDRGKRQGNSQDVLREEGLGTVGGKPELGVGGAASNLEECMTNGFETTVSEDCVEVTEDECRPINVTRYRTEIVNRCKTHLDKSCNVTHIDVPHEVCLPTQQQICQTEFKLVKKKTYKEECYTKIQNVCEEHIAVPYEVPVPIPTSTPMYHYSTTTQNSYLHQPISHVVSHSDCIVPNVPPNGKQDGELYQIARPMANRMVQSYKWHTKKKEGGRV